mgnify:CR=1 FL=1
MTNSNPLFSQLSRETNKNFQILLILLIIFSFLGLLDSAYLTFKYYEGGPLVCAIFEGCDKVAQSPYSTMFGVPVALFGVFYYLAVFYIAIFVFEFRRFKILKILFPLTIAGFLASLYFLYLQIFVIEAICTYCIFSLLTSTALFITAIFLFKKAELMLN